MSAKQRDGKGKGLWIGADVLANTDLNWTEKALYAYLRFRAEKGGEFWEFNRNIAETLGMSESTVKRGLARLAELGIVEGRKGDGFRMRVRMGSDWYAEKGIPDGSNMRGAGQTEPCGAVQTEPGQGSERTPAQVNLNPGTGQSEPRILIEQGIDTINKTEEEDKTPSSSVLVEKERTPSVHPQLHADGGAGQGMAPPDAATLARLRDVAAVWARQVCGLTCRRIAVRKKRDNQGEWKEESMDLRVSTPAGCRDRDILTVLGIARQRWPNSDPVQAFRSLLRACAAGSNRVDKLQDYGGIARTNSIGLANIVKLGGNWKEEPATYARECAGSMWEPLDPVDTSAEGLDALAGEIKNHLMRDLDAWDGEEWKTEWLEAAARCRAAKVDAGFYAACVQWQRWRINYNEQSYPPPWVASDMQMRLLDEFKRLYAVDRLNAWNAGPVWNTDTAEPCDSVKYDFCNGVRMARAVATGETAFQTRTCLLCAAAELEFMPELAGAVPEWRGTAEELAARLREAADATTQDVPPFRTDSCGREGRWNCSLIKCPFDRTKSTGCYTPDFAWEREAKRPKPFDQATFMARMRGEEPAGDQQPEAPGVK